MTTYRRTKDGWIPLGQPKPPATRPPGRPPNPAKEVKEVRTYTRRNQSIMARGVKTPLGTFASMRAAGIAHNMSGEGIKYRIKSGWKGYEYLTQENVDETTQQEGDDKSSPT